MAVLTYKVKASELDSNFLESIKSLFKNQHIAITIEPADSYQASAAGRAEKTIWDIIAENEQSEFTYEIPGEAFSGLVEQFSADNNFDLVGAIQAYQVKRT